MEQWAAGQFQQEVPLETALANAGALAEVKVTTELRELTHEQLEGVLDDE